MTSTRTVASASARPQQLHEQDDKLLVFHPSDEDLAMFVSAKVPYFERRPILLHLERCGQCRGLVTEVVLSQTFVP